MDGYKRCPDCAREGNADPQPLANFYKTKAARYAGGYRYSAYCRRHTKARNAKAARDAPPGSGTHESRKRARATWRARNPERVKEQKRRWRERNKAARAKTYSAWAKANTARRKASQQAWYRRRKQRTPEQE